MTHVILILAQLCFASLAILGRLAFATIPADAIVLTRIACGGLVFYAIARLRGWQALRREDRRLLVACGLLGVVFNQVLFLHGLERSTATNGVVLGATIPVFAATFAVLLGREAFRWTRAAGIALALVGAFLLLGIEKFSFAGGHLVGNAMILVNCMSYALFLVLVRPLSTRYPALQLTAMLFGVASLAVVVPGGVAWAELAPRLTGDDALLLAAIVAIPTVGAYSLTQIGLKRAESSLVATYIYLQPVFGVTLATIFLGERPGSRVFAAAALIFTGVFVSTRPATAKAPPPDSRRAPDPPSPVAGTAPAADR